MRVRCPDHARWDGDLVGCGHEFEAEPDWEGFIDCPNCGIWFYPEDLLALCVCGVAENNLAYHTQACPAYLAGHRTPVEGRRALSTMQVTDS